MGLPGTGPRRRGGPLNRLPLVILLIGVFAGAALILLLDGSSAFVGIPVMIVLGFVAGTLQRVSDEKRKRAERRAARKGARRT